MAVKICPWCQSEVSQEEGKEPDKICPICDNELDGYRTLKLSIGDSDDTEDDEDEETVDVEETEDYAYIAGADTKEDLSWNDDDSTADTDDELIQFEETVEQLLNEQELVPECPLCHEYMVEVGEQVLSADHFRPRVTEIIGESIVVAPFTLMMYLCPTCFSMHSFLGDSHRHQVVRRLSQGEHKN